MIILLSKNHFILKLRTNLEVLWFLPYWSGSVNLLRGCDSLLYHLKKKTCKTLCSLCCYSLYTATGIHACHLTVRKAQLNPLPSGTCKTTWIKCLYFSSPHEISLGFGGVCKKHLVFASKLKPKEKEEILIDLKAMHAIYSIHCWM